MWNFSPVGDGESLPMGEGDETNVPTYREKMEHGCSIPAFWRDRAAEGREGLRLTPGDRVD